MKSFKRLVREIHRRSLWQVVGIYLVGAWIGYQVTLGLTDGLGLPEWVPPLAFILFVIGLPIVTATAFVQEGGPGDDALRPEARAGDDPHRPLGPNGPADQPPATEVGSSAPDDHLVHAFFTWPRALLGGVLAFALLGAGTAGWMGMRALGVGPVASLVAAGSIEDQERILIADFGGSPDLGEIPRVVKHALEIDFARSTLVRVVGSSEIRDVLRRMDRDEGVELDTELAREVALRTGINVYLTGDVAPLGSGYIISIRLVGTATGETLLAARETARDENDLIPAVDRLSRHLRERVQYRNMDDLVRAEGYFRRALETDSSQILTLENLTSVLHPLERFDELRELSEAAVVLDPEVVSSRIRLAGLPAVHGDYRAVEQALRALVEDPESSQRIIARAGSHLVGALMVQGRLEEAQESRRTALGAHPLGDDFAELQSRIWTVLQHHERPEEARLLFPELERMAEARSGEDDDWFEALAEICAALGDGACARRHLDRTTLADTPGATSPWWHHRIHGLVAGAEADLPAAFRHLRRSNTVYCRNCFEIQIGALHARNGDSAAAIASYERFLASQSTDRLRHQEWEVPLIHIRLARLYEDQGDLAEARRHHARLIELWEQADPELQYRVEDARQALARLEAAGS